MAIFKYRLKERMDLKKVKAPAMAEAIGVHPNTFRHYLSPSDEAYPGADQLPQICHMLNCSSDYLIGLTDSKGLSPMATECATIIDTLDDLEQQIIYILLEGLKSKREAILQAQKVPKYVEKITKKQ